MSNSWLCFRRRILQTLQFRHFSTLPWFQNRSNVLSLETEVMLENESIAHKNFGDIFTCSLDKHPLLLEGTPCTSLADSIDFHNGIFRKNAKFDIVSMITSLGARNQELMNSLSQIIEPLDCKDTIHIGNNTFCSQNFDTVRKSYCSEVSAFKSFDLFTPLAPDFMKDSLAKASTIPLPQRDLDHYADSKQSTSDKKETKDEPKGPSLAQLEQVREYYLEIVPDFHRKGEDLSAKLHASNLVFENHFFKKPKVTRGLQKYMMELAKLRILATLAYPSYYFEIQSISTHPKDGQVKMHWRLYYVTNWSFVKRIFSLMRDIQGRKKGHDSVDAISTFQVNKEGKISYHKIDRMIPLQEEVSPVEKIKAKTVEIVGLAPKAPCDSSPKGTI